MIDFDQEGRIIENTLFKYYPLRDYHIDAFLNGELFFAKSFAFNDSFDTSNRLIDPFSRFKDAIGWNEEMSSMLASHGIVSFIEAESVKNSRMWSFYAENYYGFALQFDQDILLKADLAPIHLMPVTYLDYPLNLDDDTLRLNIDDTSFSIKEVIDLKVADYRLLDRLFQCLHLTKDSSVWREENEWRMILGSQKPPRVSIREKKNGYLVKVKDNPVSALYIGCRVPETERQMLLSIAFSKGIKCYLVSPQILDNKWDIDVTPII